MAPEQQRRKSGCATAALQYASTHTAELVAYVCDAITAILVVAVQDVAFKEAITACAALSVVSFGCNWRSHALGQRVVFPKSIEVMVPLMCIALVPPAWLREEETHRVVYLVICSTASLTMLGTVLLGRSFAMEFFMDWYPRPFWGTPLVRRLTTRLAWTWIITQAMMAAAAAVVLVKGSADEALYITMNYVMQLLPLIVAIAATVIYPKVLKRRWGYDPDDPRTGYPPSERSGLQLPLAEGPSGTPSPEPGCFGAAPRDGGAPARSGSRQQLLGSWLLLGYAPDGCGEGAGGAAASEAGAGAAAGAGVGGGFGAVWVEHQAAAARGLGAGRAAATVVGPVQSPTRRGAAKGGSGGGGSGAAAGAAGEDALGLAAAWQGQGGTQGAAPSHAHLN